MLAVSVRNSILWMLLLLLAGSGCAALIYEIVWLQLLQLVIGSSAVSLGLLLAAYMGGLCLGSATMPRLVSWQRNPLIVYACLELGIATFGMITLFGLPALGRVYLAGPTSGMLGLVMRGGVAAACLLPPTIRMGASFPAIARWVESPPKAVSWLGALYSANIAGAVAGCLIAGFYLLRVYDMATATYAAAALNAAVALAALVLAGTRGQPPRPVSWDEGAAPLPRRAPGAILVYIAIALAGLSVLASEVLQTRLLSLLLGAT